MPRHIRGPKILNLAKAFFPNAFKLSEGPVVDPANLTQVAFVDINAGNFHWLDLENNRIVRTVNLASEGAGFHHACAILPATNNRWLAVGTHCVGVLDKDYKLVPDSVVTLETNPRLRFNDCQVVDGEVWGGTIECATFRLPLAAFGRLAPDGFHKVQTKHTISNGIAATSDGKTLYHIESTQPEIWVYDRNPKSKELSNRRKGFRMLGSAVFPAALGDGMALCNYLGRESLAIAEWGLGRIGIYSLPDGTLSAAIPTPVTRPTSICFAGTKFDEVLITSEADPSNECALCRTRVEGLTGFPPKLATWT